MSHVMLNRILNHKAKVHNKVKRANKIGNSSKNKDS